MQQLTYDISETPENENIKICRVMKNSNEKDYLEDFRNYLEYVGEIIMEITTKEGAVFIVRENFFPPKPHVR